MNQNMTLAERVEQTKLTRTEEKIVEMVMNDISKAAFFNGAQLAAFCGVSASLVTRLIQKLGYQSFNEFKLELQEIYRQEVTPYDIFQKKAVRTAPSMRLLPRISRTWQPLSRIIQPRRLMRLQMLYTKPRRSIYWRCLRLRVRRELWLTIWTA